MLKNNFKNSVECNGKYFEKFETIKKEEFIDFKTYEMTRTPLFGRKPMIIEGFLNKIGAKGGNTTNITSNTNVTKKADLQTNIDRSMVVDSTNKIMNNAVNKVAQSNQTNVAQAVGCSNTILISGVLCDKISVSDTNQESNCESVQNTTINQVTKNSAKNTFKTSIEQQVTNSLPNDAAELQNANNQALKEFMDATPGYNPNQAKELAGGVSNSGFNNKTNINTNYNLDAELKKAFNLNDSFKVNSNQDIDTKIENTVNQDNFASCQSSALSTNNITIADVKCKELIVNKIKQKAVAKSVLNCVFEQSAVSDITNSVMNSLDQNFSRMYDSYTPFVNEMNKQSDGSLMPADKEITIQLPDGSTQTLTPQQIYDALYRLDAFGNAIGENLRNAGDGLTSSDYASKSNNPEPYNPNSSGGSSYNDNDDDDDNDNNQSDNNQNNNNNNQSSNNQNDDNQSNDNQNDNQSQDGEDKDVIDDVLVDLGIQDSTTNKYIFIAILIIIVILFILLIITAVSPSKD